MKEVDIRKYYKKKINELKNHNKMYYDKSSPIITDNQYDEIKKEILTLEKKYTYLKSRYSPSNSFGYTPSKNFVKSIHRVKMLSLSNAFNTEDLENFEKKFLTI